MELKLQQSESVAFGEEKYEPLCMDMVAGL